jgi:hypothetical protein
MASGIFLLLIIVQPTGIRASPLVSHSLGDHAAPRLIRIHEVVSVKAEADTAYILMTVQTERGQLVEAVRENEKQMQAFIAALTQTGIPLAAISIKNFVVEPAIVGRGFSLARNLVITEAQINRRPAGELAQRMARIQDLGARFGSSCITCIGSG